MCSKEDAISKDRVVASSIFVPSTAGLTIAHYIIEKSNQKLITFFFLLLRKMLGY